MPGIKLIIGLGNPGAEYNKTRHNAGAWFIQELAREANTELRSEIKFHGLYSKTHLDGHECYLLIPTTFMNLSGQAVKALTNFYKISPETTLIAHDDIDLSVGDIRLKLDGGHGGHNGLRNIIQQLNTQRFYRLRIGVGHPGQSHDVHHYVLNPPQKIELEQIHDAMFKAKQIMPLLFNGEFQKAMQKLHTQL